MNTQDKEFLILRRFPHLSKSFKEIETQPQDNSKRELRIKKRHTTDEQDKIIRLQRKLSSMINEDTCLSEVNELALVYGNIRQCRSLRYRPTSAVTGLCPSSSKNSSKIDHSQLLADALRKVSSAGIPIYYCDDNEQNVLQVLDSLFAVLQYRKTQLLHEALDPNEFKQRLYLTLGVSLSEEEVNAMLGYFIQ